MRNKLFILTLAIITCISVVLADNYPARILVMVHHKTIGI